LPSGKHLTVLALGLPAGSVDAFRIRRTTGPSQSTRSTPWPTHPGLLPGLSPHATHRGVCASVRHAAASRIVAPADDHAEERNGPALGTPHGGKPERQLRDACCRRLVGAERAA